MMEEYGRVLSSDDGLVKVEIVISRSVCGRCQFAAGCALKGLKRAVVDATNDINAAPGDYVRVELEPRKLLLGGFLIYILPVIDMLVFYYIAAYFLESESIRVLISIVAGILSFLAISIVNRHTSLSDRYRARLLGFAGPENFK